jgi:hypothetical protein
MRQPRSWTEYHWACKTHPSFQFPDSMIEDFLMFGGTLADQLRPVWADLDLGTPTPDDTREYPWAAFARDEDAEDAEEEDDEDDEDDLEDEDLDEDLDDEFDDDLDDDFDDLDDEDLDDDFDDFDDDDDEDDDDDDEEDEVDEA